MFTACQILLTTVIHTRFKPELLFTILQSILSLMQIFSSRKLQNEIFSGVSLYAWQCVFVPEGGGSTSTQVNSFPLRETASWEVPVTDCSRYQANKAHINIYHHQQPQRTLATMTEVTLTVFTITVSQKRSRYSGFQDTWEQSQYFMFLSELDFLTVRRQHKSRMKTHSN